MLATSTNLVKTQSNMKLVLDEWIIREVIDTLYMARTTLLGITGLDSPQEVAKKSANETAITRRISKAIDIIQQSEQPDVDLEKEVDKFLNETGAPYVWCNDDEQKEWCNIIARHFAEWGAIHLNARSK